VSWVVKTIDDLDANIKALQAAGKDKAAGQSPGIPAIEGAETGADREGTINVGDGDVNPNPRFGIGLSATATAASSDLLPVAGSPSDPWVQISASFSAQDQMDTSNSQSWGFSVGGGAGWGLWSVGGAYAHDETSTYVYPNMS
jgi:hypothetical protein